MDLKPVELTYAGRRMTARDTLAYFYEPVDSPGTLRGFKKPLVTGVTIGAIVRIQTDDDGSFFTGGPNRPLVRGQADDHQRLLRWSVEQEAAVAEHAQTLESKRIAKAGADPIRQQLDPIRTELLSMSSARRAATIGWIISYLSTGKGR